MTESTVDSLLDEILELKAERDRARDTAARLFDQSALVKGLISRASTLLARAPQDGPILEAVSILECAIREEYEVDQLLDIVEEAP